MKVIQVGIGGMGNTWLKTVQASSEVEYAGFLDWRVSDVVKPADAPLDVKLDEWYRQPGRPGKMGYRLQVTLKSDTWAVIKQRRAAGTMPMFLLGWYPDYFDTDDYISPFYSISGAAQNTGAFYNNTQVDQWVTQEQTTTNPAPSRRTHRGSPRWSP